MKNRNIADLSKNIDFNFLTPQELQALLNAVGANGNVYQEIEMSCSLVQTHSDVTYSSAKVGQHSHSFYELLYCAQGSIEYLLGTKRYHIRTGDIIMVPPGVIHCPILPEQMAEPYRRHVIWLSTGFTKYLLTLFPDTTFHKVAPRVLRTAGTRWEYLEQYFSRGVQESAAKALDWDLCVFGNTIQLIGQLRRALYHIPNDHASHQDNDLLESVLNYIHHNLAGKITLSATAKHFAVCESTIGLLFQKQMGISFYQCVIQRRLAEAKKRIGTGLSMEQVAVSVGFQDYSAFYRAFKAEFGISPREFKKLGTLSDSQKLPDIMRF